MCTALLTIFPSFARLVGVHVYVILSHGSVSLKTEGHSNMSSLYKYVTGADFGCFHGSVESMLR